MLNFTVLPSDQHGEIPMFVSENSHFCRCISSKFRACSSHGPTAPWFLLVPWSLAQPSTSTSRPLNHSSKIQPALTSSWSPREDWCPWLVLPRKMEVGATQKNRWLQKYVKMISCWAGRIMPKNSQSDQNWSDKNQALMLGFVGKTGRKSTTLCFFSASKQQSSGRLGCQLGACHCGAGHSCANSCFGGKERPSKQRKWSRSS